MKKQSLLDIIIKVYFSILIFFFVTILFRFITKQIFIDKLGWNNSFTKTIFFDQEIESTSDTADIEIDWKAKYPFPIEPYQHEINTEEKINFPKLNKYLDIIENLKTKTQFYSEDYLIGYQLLTKMGKKYNSLIGFDTMPTNDKEAQLIILNNGYITYKENLIESKNITEIADSVSDFSEYLEARGIYFIYANTGTKVCPTDMQLPSGSTDNININADRLLDTLSGLNVNTLDYREYQLRDYSDWYSTYYITDQHWKNSTGLWAAKILAEHLNENAGFDFNLDYFNENKWNIEQHEGYLLGSQGRVLTTSVVKPEPFEKIVPLFETDFSIQIPTKGIDVRGDYSHTLFDEKAFDEIANYSINQFETSKDPYHCVAWTNDALGKIQNHLAEDNEGKKILILQDSFGWFLSTYLATDIPEIDLVNLKSFNGSIKAYIEETNPDAVIVLLCSQNIRPINWEMHDDYLDFR